MFTRVLKIRYAFNELYVNFCGWSVRKILKALQYKPKPYFVIPVLRLSIGRHRTLIFAIVLVELKLISVHFCIKGFIYMIEMSSSSSSNSSVSYIQIYKRWVGADHRRNEESTIPVGNILFKLKFRNVVRKSEYQMVDHETTDEEKVAVSIRRLILCLLVFFSLLQFC